MPLSSEETIHLLLKTNKEQEETIQDLRTTVKELRATIANLNETLEELKRKLFGASSERTCAQSDINTGSEDQLPADVATEETETTVKEHTRKRKKKSVRADLYEALPVKEIPCDVPEAERFCPDCDSAMEHLGYKFVREELRITPAKVVRVRYMQETLVCPVCRQEDETTIKAAKAPTPLLVHSPASPDMVAMVMYQKSFLHLPFYRQSKDWIQKGVPVPRETAAHWYNYCALEYLSPIYESLHQELLAREVIHADEVPCQVLHEQGRAAHQDPICGSISAEQMESLLSSCMITDRDAAAIIPSSFCLDLPGCSTVMVIPHMEGLKMLSLYAVWLTAGENFMKPFRKSGEKS